MEFENPGDFETRRVAYNGPKRKQTLNFKAVLALEGLDLHLSWCMKVMRH